MGVGGLALGLGMAAIELKLMESDYNRLDDAFLQSDISALLLIQSQCCCFCMCPFKHLINEAKPDFPRTMRNFAPWDK